MAFFTSNLAKVEHGAWLPLLVALAISFVMITWRRGQMIVTRNRTEKEGSLEMSNVKVVEEMVDMITAQRAYEINSKSIQAADEMLQVANNLRR